MYYMLIVLTGVGDIIMNEVGMIFIFEEFIIYSKGLKNSFELNLS